MVSRLRARGTFVFSDKSTQKRRREPSFPDSPSALNAVLVAAPCHAIAGSACMIVSNLIGFAPLIAIASLRSPQLPEVLLLSPKPSPWGEGGAQRRMRGQSLPPPGGCSSKSLPLGEIAEALPVADKARRFRGSVPLFTTDGSEKRLTRRWAKKVPSKGADEVSSRKGNVRCCDIPPHQSANADSFSSRRSLWFAAEPCRILSQAFPLGGRCHRR